jgi:uncharacterized membrane protein
MISINYLFVKIVLFALAVSGFIVARHIHKHKKPDAKIPLVCPMNFDCHTVVHSDYSRFLGIPVEILGMIDYTIISIFYLTFILFPSIISPLSVGIIVLITLIAFIFCLYLISIQLFVLKKGCFWCYISSLICILIFILTLLIYNFTGIVQGLMIMIKR